MDNNFYVFENIKNEKDIENYFSNFALDEGWDTNLNLYNLFLESDMRSGCFFMKILFEENCVGSIVGSFISENVCCIAHFIIVEKSRGKGLGGKIFSNFLSKFDENVKILLFCENHLENFYSKFDFQTIDTGTKFYGFFEKVTLIISEKEDNNVILLNKQESDFKENLIEKILNYDINTILIDRKKFLKNSIENKMSRTFISKNGENISGYGILLEIDQKVIIGPIICNTFQDFDKILKQMALNSPNDEFIIHIPISNSYYQEIEEKYELLKSHDFQIMQKIINPSTPSTREETKINYTNIFSFSNSLLI